MKRIAGVLGCTEGQAYTLTIGVALAGLLLAGTVPAALRERPISAVARDFELATQPAPEAAPKSPPVTAAVDDGGSGPTTTAPFIGEAPSSPTLRPRVAAVRRGSPRPTESAGAPTPTTTTTAAPASTTAEGSAPPLEVASTPLAVLEGGWATTGSGTPAARANVPPDTLPVAANAGGSTTRRSFVRLRGTNPVLFLRLKGDAGATVNDTGAAVLACAITDERWTPQEAIALEAAPPFDPKRCAAGSRQNDGSWRFDLAAFADRSGRAGFTLVPDPARATTPFQLAYDPTPGAPS